MLTSWDETVLFCLKMLVHRQRKHCGVWDLLGRAVLETKQEMVGCLVQECMGLTWM